MIKIIKIKFKTKIILQDVILINKRLFYTFVKVFKC